MAQVTCNFFSDWIDILKSDLINRSYSIDPAWNDHEVSNVYFNLLQRLVESKPRTVMISESFNCPIDLQNGLKLIIEKIKNGAAITPHLSKLIKNLKYDDDLLNDWGVYHLHLGVTLESNGEFIERTGPLLYARFDDTKAYLINVLDHHSFTKQDIIRTIHQNWPESIQQFRLEDGISLTHRPTDHNIKELRKGHVNSMIEIEPGVVYTPIGGGLMTSGISLRAVRLTRKYQKIAVAIENDLKKDIDKILADNGLSDLAKTENLIFKLEIIDDKFYAVEVNSRVAIYYGSIR